jgi:hypothetical protein
MSADQLREIIGRKPFRPVVVTTVAGDVVVPHALFSIVAAVLLGLVGCASQSKPLSAQGKPLSGYVRLTQKQVGFPGSYIATDDTMGQEHQPGYIERGKLNVGSGVLDYQGRKFVFYIQGLGAGGLSINDIQAEGEVCGLERLHDFSGNYISPDKSAYVSASVRVDSASGLWLKNASGVILHITPRREQRDKVLSIAGDTVVIKLNRYSPIDHLRNGK